MKPTLAFRFVAEFLGTALLVAAVVGSGIMAERLSSGNIALALLANTLATGAALVALILTFGPISGAHFNPAVSLADTMEGGLTWSDFLLYVIAQCAGGVAGTILAHAMFGLPFVTELRPRFCFDGWYRTCVRARGMSFFLIVRRNEMVPPSWRMTSDSEVILSSVDWYRQTRQQ